MLKFFLLTLVSVLFYGCTSVQTINPDGSKTETKRFCGIPYFEENKSTKNSGRY